MSTTSAVQLPGWVEVDADGAPPARRHRHPAPRSASSACFPPRAPRGGRGISGRAPGGSFRNLRSIPKWNDRRRPDRPGSSRGHRPWGLFRCECAQKAGLAGSAPVARMVDWRGSPAPVAENGDNADDGSAGEGLRRRGVAAPVRKIAPSVVALTSPGALRVPQGRRRQALPVDGGNRDHDKEPKRSWRAGTGRNEDVGQRCCCRRDTQNVDDSVGSKRADGDGRAHRETPECAVRAIATDASSLSPS